MPRLYNGKKDIDSCSSLKKGEFRLYSDVNNSRTAYFDFKNNIMKYIGNSGNPM